VSCAACAPPPQCNGVSKLAARRGGREMHYMERGDEKRCDPQKILPGARSIIVVALNYFSVIRLAVQTAATGKIARYAWGNDLSRCDRDKACQIDNFLVNSTDDKSVMSIRTHSGTRSRSRAGIGWHGKSTMLVDPRLARVFSRRNLTTPRSTPG